MPKLDEICSIPEAFTKMVDEMRRKEEEAIEARRLMEETRHRKTHIFESYEDAIEWMKRNPGKRVEWHAKSLTYIEERDVFESYEQEYDFSGVMVYNVKRHYTSEELISGIHDAIREHGWDISELKDEWGKLDYVYIH